MKNNKNLFFYFEKILYFCRYEMCNKFLNKNNRKMMIYIIKNRVKVACIYELAVIRGRQRIETFKKYNIWTD